MLFGSSDKEKINAINNFLNRYFFQEVEKKYDGITGLALDNLKKYYKYRIAFNGENENYMASFSMWHSVIAKLVLDYPKVENEHKIVTNLRENKDKILGFANNPNITQLEIKNCDRQYQRFYRDMLRHILYSIKDFPGSVVNIDSLRKISKDLTYVIEKKI